MPEVTTTQLKSLFFNSSAEITGQLHFTDEVVAVNFCGHYELGSVNSFTKEYRGFTVFPP